MIEQVQHNGLTLALIVRNNYREQGVHFFTPEHFSQQLAYMRHPVGKVIAPHVHNIQPREVFQTQEVLFIKKGSLRVDFYSENGDYLESRVIEEGDVILLACGGHGFEVLQEIEMIEVKQGPFNGDIDKRRFPVVAPSTNLR